MMNWHRLQLTCTACHSTIELREFHYALNGQIKVVSYCYQCEREVPYVVDSQTLRQWANEKDNPFPSDKDKIFLKELLVSWDKASE